MTRMVQLGLLAALLVAGMLMVGCADDLYGSCSISPDPGDPLESCLEGGERDQRSCVATGELECQTGACGRYRGSRFFCTAACSSDGDCDDGVCRQFVLHQPSYCVAHEDLPDGS